MIYISKFFKTYKIKCNAVPMGNNWNISIYGGDIPHIGAVALGIPRPSLENPNNISSSVSLLTITGHKEDSIVLKAAKNISKSLNSTIVVCCGIHIKNITLNEILELEKIIDELITELISKIKKSID